MHIPVASEQRELLRLATAGSVDDGKSTLIGRLLLDTKTLLSDHLEQVTKDGEGPDLAALTDGLRAEREQGITIDVAYRFFQTQRRAFILADTPGHERYTRNMFTGASTADVAIVLIDARAGVVTQTRRHAHISALLGIRHIVACVNKMDLVGFDRTRFTEVEADVLALTTHLNVPDVTVIPISALEGDNVVDRSPHTPWYEGPALLEHLEGIDIVADTDLAREHLRLPVQWVGRPSADRPRSYTGQIASGRIAAGDEVLVLPEDIRTTVTAVDTLSEESGAEGVPPLSVSISLADDLDLGRGDMLVSPLSPPVQARELDATICWMADEPLEPGRRYALKHTTRTVRATVQAILRRIDPDTLLATDDPAQLALNDIGRVHLRTSAPVLVDPYTTNRITGAFILVDEATNGTVAAGLVETGHPAETFQATRRDITWHPSALDRDDRYAALGLRGATVWLTGLPASGKSTLAVALERRLVEDGRAAYLLDGDNVRHGLSDDLGFSPGDRHEHIRRVGQVARLMADAGLVSVVSLVSPMAADRAVARELHEAAGLAFFEVHVDTPVEECKRRDPKGLYAKAAAGNIANFTGVDGPYDVPTSPELRVVTAEETVDAAVDRILTALS